jgi:hypothetical protein
MTTHHKGGSHGGGSGSGQGGTAGNPADPQFVMDEVKLLVQDITTPETTVKFDPPARADTVSIQNTIAPPEISYRWANDAARLAEPVKDTDVGKYGYQIDVNTQFRLTSTKPVVVWQPFFTGTIATWTWANTAQRQAEKVLPGDVGKTGLQTDINTMYQLIAATPAVWKPVPNPTDTSSPFELSKGASDADSYHDFFRLQVAFQDVWAELLDQRIAKAGEQLYAMWDALMDSGLDDSGATDRATRYQLLAPLPTGPDISGAAELQAFIDGLSAAMGIGGGGPNDMPAAITQLKDDLTKTLQGCDMLLQELNRVGKDDGTGSTTWSGDDWLNDTPEKNPLNDMGAFPAGMQRRNTFTNTLNDLGSVSGGTAPVPTFPDFQNLLKELDAMLKERYRFDVFAPASINYGLLLNYRQHWQPQSYQVGNLVSTIPLAPQETRRYTTKTVVKKTRNVKEIDASVTSGKSESSDTFRVDSEIVNRAKNQTSFQQNASGSFGNDNLYKVSAGMQQGQDQSVESAQTKREFHESVIKSAQEYRNEHRLEITTEETREDESTTYREIRNPNDELTVTYLFYELQRRYLVDEHLYRVTPVIMVANDVPAPQDVDSAWLLRHDWILKRTILDNSFLPALEYLSTNYAGEEVTLQVLGLNVEQQKALVDKLSLQVQLANASLNAATLGLESAENQEVSDLQQAETMSIVKSVFDPLGITKSGGDGNSDRARVDFAKDAFNRAQDKVNKLVADLKGETTALQVAIDKYTKAATHHFSMLADIDRLRIHVKDNIIYYMQAIWTYEPPDQRFYRLCNLDVPVFTHNTTVNVTPATGLATIDTSRTNLSVIFPPPTLDDATMKLHQVADLENLIGFKGNYMIFPMVDFNYMNWFMMQPYLDLSNTTGVTAKDPDPLATLTIDELVQAIQTIRKQDPESFTPEVQQMFEEYMTRMLSTANQQMVIVPSNSLYIEALPGTHPLLEDFKLIHRAIDIKKAQAEARHAELENLRLAARLANGQNGDPDIDKVVVVGSGQNVTVDAGQ